ncbi:hypothetical protein WJX81_005505 [Elliptochloris bilobata]|uniref:CBM2 domain-containing protein n=1 Tax=Elliptochloris bilobata TaxID=381761 RepID=A0AAW1SHQ9_9CHLO
MAARTRALACALLALTLCQLQAAAALKILFVGNSITYYNSGLDVVTKGLLVQKLNTNNIYAIRCANPNYSWAQHLADTNTSGTCQQQNLASSQAQWDFVVLQEETELPGLGGSAYAQSLAALQGLAALAQARGARVVLLQTFGWLTGKNTYFANYLTMQNAVDAGIGGYAKALAAAGVPVSIAPVGDAFKSIYQLAVAEGSALSATASLSALAPSAGHAEAPPPAMNVELHGDGATAAWPGSKESRPITELPAAALQAINDRAKAKAPAPQVVEAGVSRSDAGAHKEDGSWYSVFTSLFAYDGNHPSEAGTYLEALVVASTISGCGMTGNAYMLPYTLGLPSWAAYLQGVGDAAVFQTAPSIPYAWQPCSTAPSCGFCGASGTIAPAPTPAPPAPAPVPVPAPAPPPTMPPPSPLTSSPTPTPSPTAPAPPPSGGTPLTLPDSCAATVQLGSPWTKPVGTYTNTVNVVVSNTGATTVPSGWLLSLTAPAGAPYVHVEQSWEMTPTLFHGSLAAFANQGYQALFPGSMATVGAVLESAASRSADWVPSSVQLNGVFCQVTSSTAAA